MAECPGPRERPRPRRPGGEARRRSAAGALALACCAGGWGRHHGHGRLLFAPAGAPPRAPRTSLTLRPRDVSARGERYSRDKLAAESQDFSFSNFRVFLFGATCALSVFGLVTSAIPRYLASNMGVKGQPPPAAAAQDVGINLAAAVGFGALAYFDQQKVQEQEQRREEGARIARLQVLWQDVAPPAPPTLLKLSDLRASRAGAGTRALRAVLMVGGPDCLCECLQTSAKYADAVDSADLLLVPVLTDPEDQDASKRVEAAAEGLRHVALPARESQLEDWEKFVGVEVPRAAEQTDVDVTQRGLVVIVKKNGRVGSRSIGVPRWDAITGQVENRRAAGMDTTNI